MKKKPGNLYWVSFIHFILSHFIMQLRKLLIAPDISQLQPCLPVSGFEQRNSAAEQNGGDLNDKLIDKFFLQNRVRDSLPPTIQIRLPSRRFNAFIKSAGSS